MKKLGFQQTLDDLVELEGHLKRLAPRNHDGELTGVYKKVLQAIGDDRGKAQKWVDSQPDYSAYLGGGK